MTIAGGPPSYVVMCPARDTTGPKSVLGTEPKHASRGIAATGCSDVAQVLCLICRHAVPQYARRCRDDVPALRSRCIRSADADRVLGVHARARCR
jgi:hypothetical protein